MPKTRLFIILALAIIICSFSSVFAMQQWHLEERGHAFPDFFLLILGIAVIYWLSFACYTKFPKIGPLVGVGVFGYLTEMANHDGLHKSYMFIGAMGLLTLISLLIAYIHFFGKSKSK